MIKSDFGVVTIKGNTPLIMAEFSSLIFGLIEQDIFTKKEIKKLVEDGMKTNEEIKNEFSKKHRNGISTLEMQEYAKRIIEARKSGLVNKKVKSNKNNIQTILDSDNFKITEISIDTNGKTEEEIKEEISEALSNAFDKDNLEDK